MASILRKTARRLGSERGAEFVEFALAFPLLLLVVLGIMDFGLMFQQYEVITNAAREGARLATLPNYTNSNVISRVQQYLDASFLTSGGAAPGISVVAQPPLAIGGGKCISTTTVTVSYAHDFLFLSGIMQYFGGSFGSRTLTASSTMRSETATVTCPAGP